MIRSLYTAVSGLITQEAKQNVITNNLANINTTGFKDDNLLVRNFKNVLIQNKDKIVGGKNVNNVIGTLSLGSDIDGVSTDFTQGMITDTDSSTDMAIEGKGFFTVLHDMGNGTQQQYYTRDGHFHTDSRGFLVNDNGDYLRGVNLQNGNLDNIFVGRGKLTVASDGTVSVDGNTAYRLQLSDFTDYNSLKKVGGNLYDGQGAVAAGNASVKQKALEKSNVNVVSEMVNMMTVMRTFETNQKVVQSIDETLDKAVNQVGTVR